MGRFETEFLAGDENFAALADLRGRWIDQVHAQHPPKAIVLDTDSSVSYAYQREPREKCALINNKSTLSGAPWSIVARGESPAHCGGTAAAVRLVE